MRAAAAMETALNNGTTRERRWSIGQAVYDEHIRTRRKALIPRRYTKYWPKAEVPYTIAAGYCKYIVIFIH